MNLDELSFLEEEQDGEDFKETLEKTQEEVQRILQSLEPSRLKEN